MLNVHGGSQAITMEFVSPQVVFQYRSNTNNFLHLTAIRSVNSSYIEGVYNRGNQLEFLQDDRPAEGFLRHFMYIRNLGVLLPADMIDLEPDVFISTVAEQITEYLNMVHSTLLSTTLNQVQPKRRDWTVDSSSFYYFRYRNAYKVDVPQCSICQDEFRSNQKVVKLHKNTCVFHERCITKWFKERPCCPNCMDTVPHSFINPEPAEAASDTI
tara:strand:- start:1480 stop:2118 length:639 start_codon:yes stop_codon:yes gene_type:complete